MAHSFADMDTLVTTTYYTPFATHQLVSLICITALITERTRPRDETHWLTRSPLNRVERACLCGLGVACLIRDSGNRGSVPPLDHPFSHDDADAGCSVEQDL